MITSYGPGNCHFGINQSNIVKSNIPSDKSVKEQSKKPRKPRKSKKTS